MSRVAVAVIAATLGLSGIAQAQTLTAAERAACQADYDKYCKSVIPGGGRIIACLQKEYGSLADACKKVVDGLKKQ